MKKIAINGFGRIGRILCRILSEYSDCHVVAINDLAEPKVLSHLLKYDSIHGRFQGNITYSNNSIFINNNEIIVLNQSQINNLPWKNLEIDVVFECTGRFKTLEENMLHINAGAKKVLMSCPSLNTDIPMVVLGVNDEVINPNDSIISNASCTTNCAAPMIKILDDALSLESGYITTVHSYTSDQNLHDGIHNDLRRARSASSSIIPTTTGAAKALSRIFPNLELSGCGIRVPVSNCSLTDITCLVKSKTDINQVNSLFKSLGQSSFKDIMFYNEDPIVSVDVKSSSYSCIFDSKLTYVTGNMVKVVGWYDNEFGYCSRLVDLLKKVI